MNLEEAFDFIDGCVLTEKDCLFLLKIIIANLEDEEPKCPSCGFPMYVSTDICISCKEKEET